VFGGFLASENRVGVAGNGVCVFHMRIPKGNVHPFVMRVCHVAVGRDLVLVPALQIPIGNRHTLGRLAHIDHFHRGAVRRIRNGFPVDPVRAVLCRLGLGLKRIVRRTNPNGRGGLPLQQRIMPAIRQGRPPRSVGVPRNLCIPVVPGTPADRRDIARQIGVVVRAPLQQSLHDLPHVGSALRRPRRSHRTANCWNGKRGQKPDDDNDHQQFY